MREVSTKEGFDFAVQNNITFFEVSALENTNLDNAMGVLSNQMFDIYMAERLKRLES